MLAAIDQAREKKQQEKLNHIFTEAENKSGTELEEAINKADQEQGSQAYQDNKEKVQELKEKRAAENPEAYQQTAQIRAKENMAKHKISEEDLADNQEIKEALTKLNSSEIKEPSVIVASEMTITEGIEKAGATKKLTNLLTQTKRILTAPISPEKKEALKSQLLEFINSSNIYWQFAYQQQKAEVQSLLSKLENDSEHPTSPTKFPLKVVLPIIASLLLIMGLVAFSVMRKKRMKRGKT